MRLLAIPLVLVTGLSAQVRFTDVSLATGVGGAFYNSATRHSLGVNWIDYDNDDRPDLFLVNGGRGLTPHLYRNKGDGTFSNVDSLLPPFDHNVDMSGSVFADYDNDGDQDIYIFTDNQQWAGVTRFHEEDGPANFLLKNLWVENGGRTVPGKALFEEVAAAAGVTDLADPPLGPLPGMRSKTGGWVDYDRDGCVDLYVGHIVFGITSGDIANRDRLYRNRCDGTFEDVTVQSQLDSGAALSYRQTLAFIAAHLDGDLQPDLYVVNVSDQPLVFRDFLFLNNGDGTFEDATDGSPGLGDDSQAGMGVDVADIDLDGDWDFYLSDLLNTPDDARPIGNVLYKGNGDGTFADNSALEDGVQGDQSWGVNFLDVDHDGYEDLFVVTMQGVPNCFLYINNGDGTFTNVSSDVPMPTVAGRGSAFADFDGDGDLDLAAIAQSDTLKLFRNDTTPLGNWLRVRLRATRSNRAAIGSLIKVTAGPLNMMRQIKGGSSAHSQDELVVHFGLAQEATVDRIEVFWPSGVTDALTGLGPNQVLTIVEGTTAEPKPRIHVVPLYLDFGSAELTTSNRRAVRIVNEGSETLTITGITSESAAFAILDGSTPFDLAPYGGSRDLPIDFVAMEDGVVSGQLRIVSNDPDAPIKTAQLQGTGTRAIPLRLRLHPGRSRLHRSAP